MDCAAQSGVEGEVFNLGTGREISVGETAKRILQAMNRDIEIVESPERLRPPNSEVDRLIADCSKIERLVGWRPEVELDDGLQRTIEWMRESLGSYKTSIYNV